MENIMMLQDQLRDLFYDVYGFEPSFGSVSDWNDPSWLARMYNSLYDEFHGVPEEFDLADEHRSEFWRDLNRRQRLYDAERYASWAAADIERGDLKSATFYQQMAKRALAGWESIQV